MRFNYVGNEGSAEIGKSFKLLPRTLTTFVLKLRHYLH